jgi:hypothetical protein
MDDWRVWTTIVPIPWPIRDVSDAPPADEGQPAA